MLNLMKKSLPEETCENCVWWNGDSFADQGYCSKQEDELTYKTDECTIEFLARDIPYDFS